MKKKELVIILWSGLLLACTNPAHQAKQEIFDEEPSVEQVGEVPERDTIAAPVEEKNAPTGTESTEKKERTEKSASAPSSSSYSPRPHQSNDDNMRGFDPASEDDMDDNGMTRYMEANDDEGWE